VAAQLIHVVRHAHAGDRDAWRLNDDLRPLSERGCGQAERLVARLNPAPAVIYSSPSLRCLATVVPLARAHHLPITTLDELYEGGSAAVMIERLRGEPSPVVACSHGDIVAALLGLVIAAGLRLESVQAAKGSTWTLEMTDGRISAARYSPPP
jgi:8-oxo-dGTP diphosphatase